jgi:hypothetical protein
LLDAGGEEEEEEEEGAEALRLLASVEYLEKKINEQKINGRH